MVFSGDGGYSPAPILREGWSEGLKFRIPVHPAKSADSITSNMVEQWWHWFIKGFRMNYRLIASVVVVGGVLMFSGIKPSDALDQGSDVWGRFSGDFWAIFNGESKDKLEEIRDNANSDLQAICNAGSATAVDDEATTIARDIYRERCETLRNAQAAIANREELKQRLKDQNVSIEELKQRLEDQRKQME